MEARAVGRYLRVTPRKARFVLDVVKGKSADEALAILKFIPNEAARYLEQLIASAVANAEHNYSLDRETLRLTTAYVDTGPTIKRIQPRAMGRAYRILRRTSHITVVLSEDERLKAAAAKAKARKPAGRRERKQVSTKPADARERKQVSTRTQATHGEAVKAEPKARRTTRKPAKAKPTETAETAAEE